MTLAETLSNLNWGGEGYSNYQGYGQDDSSPPDFSGFTYSGPTAPIGQPGGLPACAIAPYNLDPAVGSTTMLGDGSTSGVSSLDASGSFITSLGSVISGVVSKIQGPQLTRLPNGQVMLPNGQVVGSTPLLQSGSGSMLLIIAAVVVVVLLMGSMGKK